MTICPRCKGEMEEGEFPALSRRDNKTDICSECGTEEAMIDAKMIPTNEREIAFVKSIGG